MFVRLSVQQCRSVPAEGTVAAATLELQNFQLGPQDCRRQRLCVHLAWDENGRDVKCARRRCRPMIMTPAQTETTLQFWVGRNHPEIISGKCYRLRTRTIRQPGLIWDHRFPWPQPDPPRLLPDTQTERAKLRFSVEAGIALNGLDLVTVSQRIWPIRKVRR